MIGKLLTFVKQAEGLLFLGVLVVKGNPPYTFILHQDSKDAKKPRDLGAMTVKAWAKWAEMHTMLTSPVHI